MRLVLMGPPGAGKNTHAALLKKKLGVPHISTGDIFRKKMESGTKIGKQIKDHVDGGELVSDDVVVSVVKERLHNPDVSKGFILDGFPRTRNQAEKFTLFLDEIKVSLDFVFDFQLPEDLIVFRLSGRRVCSGCLVSYHLINVPPKKPGICDACGAKLIQRKDDDEDVIRNRLRIYHETAQPVLEYYRQRKILVELDSSDKGRLNTRIVALIDGKNKRL